MFKSEYFTHTRTGHYYYLYKQHNTHKINTTTSRPNNETKHTKTSRERENKYAPQYINPYFSRATDTMIDSSTNEDNNDNTTTHEKWFYYDVTA